LASLRLGLDGPVQLMTSDMERFMQVINRSDIKKIRMTQMSDVIKFIERLSWINDPFKKFADRFKDHVNDIGKYVKEINNIKEVPFKQFLDLNAKVIELVKSDTNKIKENLAAVTQALTEINTAAQQQMQPSNTQPGGGFLSGMGTPFGSIFGGNQQQASTSTVQQSSSTNNNGFQSVLERIEQKLCSVIIGGVMRVNDVGD
jgi:methyl-accepting chemotaxis protein